VAMTTLLTIGEFSRVTHLSVKALRHYDEVGLLRPAEIDASTGYRRYAAAQVPVAHVIRRFRDLDMPLAGIREVLEAPDLATRDRAIVGHLERMERVLEQTQETVASLRTLLDGTGSDLPVEYRSVPATPALAIIGRVAWDDTEAWLADALGELGRAVGPDSGRRAGPDGALYSPEFFEQHVGEVVAFVPLTGTGEAPAPGRVERVDIPAADLAVTVHRGPFADVDRAYGALGTFVAEHMLGADGPIREHYLEGDPDPATEVCWPISRGQKTIQPDSRVAR
jgi:DNA-binding transcriptional MerR regulator/effector-binding domain-containing protein